MSGSSRLRGVTLAMATIVVAGAVVLTTSQVTTRQGVNFHVSTRRIPLHVKAVDFLHRHWQYRLLAREITRDCTTDQARALAVLAWTREHIKPTPAGWPVVDDHILHIIIRGYGESDQMADVFATLATYAGVDAFWKACVRRQGELAGTVLSFARIDGRWTAFDVERGVVFTASTGRLASVEELAAHPDWVTASAAEVRTRRPPYESLFAKLVPFAPPHPLRAQEQMPWPRCWHAVQRVVGRFGGWTPRESRSVMIAASRVSWAK